MDDSKSKRRRAASLKAYMAAFLDWRAAIEQAENGDTGGIIELLSAGELIPPEAQQLLADLLGRRHLVKKRGGQQMPSYEMTAEESRLKKAAFRVRELQDGGMPLNEAIEKAAEWRKLSFEKLAGYIDGRGSRRYRRKRARHES